MSGVDAFEAFFFVAFPDPKVKFAHVLDFPETIKKRRFQKVKYMSPFADLGVPGEVFGKSFGASADALGAN